MTTKSNMKFFLKLCVSAVILTGCSLGPGMYMDSKYNSSDNYGSIYVDSISEEIVIENINDYSKINTSLSVYRIGNGDQISITVWGLQDIFPIANIAPDQNLRRVDSNGNIYFPYAGTIKAAGKTQNELRNDLSYSLSKFFTEPQLDVSIARFNSQKVYLLGEVTRPSKIFISDIPLSLSEALGEANGLNTNTSSASEVFIIRQSAVGNKPKIFRADLSTPAAFLDANNFYLADNDIVYVNAKSTTRWNRVISQFFPFSSFLNSVDNLVSSD